MEKFNTEEFDAEEFINSETEKEVKSKFVKEFGELLNKYGVEDIKELKYTDASKDGCITEYVTVVHNDGYTYSLSVSMDSLAAIIRDVMKTLY